VSSFSERPEDIAVHAWLQQQSRETRSSGGAGRFFKRLLSSVDKKCSDRQPYLSITGPKQFAMSSPTTHRQRHWYVVYSKPHKESAAQFHLCAKGLEVFFPRLSLPRSSKRANPIIPLFPNYLFVRFDIDSEEYGYVAWSPGVNRIVGFNGQPIPMDEEALGFLQSRSNAEGIILAESSLRPGQEVRITEGPFNGLLGIIREPPNAKGRVKVLLTLLNRPAAVDLPLDCIETAWTALRVCGTTRGD
jgi:transcriptional antiterminator RfaH